MTRVVLAFSIAILLGAATASAQQTDEQRAQWRAQRAAQGAESGGPRPPETASPEERRAFWQQRAAERAKAEAAAAGGSAGAAAGGERPSEDRIAGWRGQRAAQGDSASDPGGGHRHAPAAAPAARMAAPAPGNAAAAGAPATSPTGATGGMRGGLRGGGGVLWLADTPPARGENAPPRRGSGGGMAMGGHDHGGPPTKRLWLRTGADPQKAPFARTEAEATVETVLVAPRGKPEGEAVELPAEAYKGIAFEMPAQGFYRVYVTTRKLQGDTLNVVVAKAEVPNFTHDAEDDERAHAMTLPRVLDNAEIEIVRERQANEGPFSQIRSGSEQAFIVLRKGLPVPNARVRFVSHQGWIKEAASDEQGRVGFQVIRDYFPPWQEFQKRFKANFLVVAEAAAAESGSYRDQPYASVRYQATLSGSYYPSPDDYRSYAWGLGLGLFAILLTGAAVYLYRRRRVKPFREVRFDEKA